MASLALLNDYFFDFFHRFTDAGVVAYALSEDTLDNSNCPKTKGQPAFVINARTKAKHCLKYLLLNVGKRGGHKCTLPRGRGLSFVFHANMYLVKQLTTYQTC